MSKHTPGPWVVSGMYGRGFDRRFEIRQEAPGISGGVHAQTVARHRTSEAYDNDEANARLIAASPDLLEACKMVMDTLGGCMTHTQHDQLRAAIAKAEGGA